MLGFPRPSLEQPHCDLSLRETKSLPALVAGRCPGGNTLESVDQSGLIVVESIRRSSPSSELGKFEFEGGGTTVATKRRGSEFQSVQS